MDGNQAETPPEYLRRLINESGKSIAKVARECDTSPSVIDSVLAGRRKIGVDLAVRIATSLDVDLIAFLVGVQILPNGTTNDKSALRYTLLGVFDELSPSQQKQLISIAKAIAQNEVD